MARDFRILHNFNGGSDGAYPRAGLILSGNTLYGTAYSGGSWGEGTVFSLSTRMARVLRTCIVSPAAATELIRIPGLILSSNTLYGDEQRDAVAEADLGTLFSTLRCRCRRHWPSSPPTRHLASPTECFVGFPDVTGPSGSNVVIQASTDLQTWTPLQTNLFGSGPLYFSDPQSTNNVQRFYRAQLSP